MPPKPQAKPGDKKAGGAQQFIDDDYSDLPTLPPINNFVFATVPAFKYKKNLQNVYTYMLKHFQFQPEDPISQKIKVIQREDIVNYAKLKQYITEEESLDLIGKLGTEKITEVFAKTTNDLIMAFEVAAKRAKRDSQQLNQQESTDVETTLWLKDFPQTSNEFKAFYQYQQHANHIHSVIVMEEKFIPESEDEEILKFTSQDPTLERYYQEQERKRIEEKKKVEFLADERIQAFNTVLEVGRIFASSQGDSQFKLCSVSRIKFQGPDSSTILHEETLDPTQPASQHIHPENEQLYQKFAQEFKQNIDQQASDLQEYRQLKKNFLAQVQTKPLMPYPEEILKKMRIEEEKQKEIQRKLEEEKKAQEALIAQQQAQALAAQKKGGAAAKTQPTAQQNTQSRTALQSRGNDRAETQSKFEEQMAKFKAMPKSRDDEEKDWNFQQFEKVIAELSPENGTPGNILAAMVYQIANQNKKAKDRAITDIDKQFILKSEDQENDINDHFDDIFNKLAIEHNVIETTFKHHSDEQLNQNKNESVSPYQSIFNENDKVSKLAHTYTFLSGDTITSTENLALQNSKLPGINNRQDMPQQPPIQQPQRESDLNAILSFSPFSASQTKRLLILHQMEKMFKNKNAHPERDFFFLDRNFVEKYDSTTLRQILVQALRYGPDMVHHYEQREDALLLGIFYKNPPGRLLRRQWTHPLKVFPDYQVWKNFVKHDTNQALDFSQLYDIESSKVGLIRTNSKYCFPSDNSVIRIDKHQIGNRRYGASLVVKDNLVFGIKENLEKFKQKQGLFEDEILNREAFPTSDRRCTFWLEFENGVKLQVEMQERQTAHLEEIPLHEPLPPNLEEEAKKMNQTNTSMMHGGDVADSSPPNLQIESAPVGQSKPSGGLNKNESTKSIKNDGKQSQLKQNPPSAATGKNVPAQQLQKSDSQKSVGSDKSQPSGPSPQELALIQKQRDEQTRLMSAASKNQFFQDRYDPTVGAKLTFTFQQGLIVMIMPNGDVSQQIVENSSEKKKYGGTLHQDSQPANLHEKSRLITRNGQVIRYFLDGNMQIFYPDGTITTTDKRKGVWFTVNTKGIKRVRKLHDNMVYDEPKRLKITEKLDPETSAVVQVREDGVLTIKYIDESRLVMMPDGTQVLTKKNTETGSGTITIITKQGFAPVRLIFDPVKARAKTVIGLGGADSMMGIENIMERTNNGKVTEVLLPDKTTVQSYQERQELEGYNNFTTNLVHLIKRDDFSIIKVRQDGEMVLISSNQRAFLNEIGKNKEFGKNDYDHYFELFGVPNERRSGVFTVNLDQGRMITQDEEGNIFIVYANGDSVEKLSVSFNLDQMVEGIEKKEPDSPRIQDGEYIEEECKFLPPPKTIAHPRLFLIKNDVGYEFYNHEQLEYLFRCNNKDTQLVNSKKSVKIDNEEAISHMFLRLSQDFNPNQTFNGLVVTPKIPQSVELVNQTVSIPNIPFREHYEWRNIIEYKSLDVPKQVSEFKDSLKRYEQMKKRQQTESDRLKVTEIKTEEHKEKECKIWMRIAREKGIDISNLVGEEYKPLKDVVNEEKKQKFLDDLDNNFFSDEDQDNE